MFTYIIFFVHISLSLFTRSSWLPGGTAKEKWKCSTASTPSKRSCPGCPLSKPRWRTSHYWDTKKQGHSKCPGLIPVVVSGHRKTVDPYQTTAVLSSAFARRGRWWMRRLASWPPSGWRRLSGWAGPGGTPGPPPSAGSPPTFPGCRLLLHLPVGLLDHLHQPGTRIKTCLCQVLRQIVPSYHEWRSYKVPGTKTF